MALGETTEGQEVDFGPGSAHSPRVTASLHSRSMLPQSRFLIQLIFTLQPAIRAAGGYKLGTAGTELGGSTVVDLLFTEEAAALGLPSKE